jgi:phage-related protein
MRILAKEDGSGMDAETQVLFYCEVDGTAPVLEWLDDLSPTRPPRVNKCVEAISRLATFGHKLRRPTADLLQDGVYELRARVGSVNLRVQYFFHGRDVAVLTHALTKERAIPPADLARAFERKRLFELDPEKHTYRE